MRDQSSATLRQIVERILVSQETEARVYLEEAKRNFELEILHTGLLHHPHDLRAWVEVAMQAACWEQCIVEGCMDHNHHLAAMGQGLSLGAVEEALLEAYPPIV